MVEGTTVRSTVQMSSVAYAPAGGVAAHNGIIIDNSEVVSKALGEGTMFSYGIDSYSEGITVSGGSTVQGIAEGNFSVGITSSEGNISVDNSSLYGEGGLFGIHVSSYGDKREAESTGGDLIIQITDPAYKVEAKATASIEELEEDIPRMVSKQQRNLLSQEVTLTPEGFTVSDVIKYAKKYMQDENIYQYYDFEALTEALTSIFEDTDFKEYASLEEIYQDIEEILENNMIEFRKYEILPMAVYVGEIQYNEEVKVLTPENGFTFEFEFMGMFYGGTGETVFAALGELPTTHAVFGIPRTPVVEGEVETGTTTTTTSSTVTTREATVAGAVDTGEGNMFVFLTMMAICSIGGMLVIQRRKKV
jgi:hypothetical protein